MNVEINTSDIVKEYRAKKAINYSSLSALATSPQAYIARDSIGSIPAFRKGSAVDCMLTTPNDFHSDFYVMNIRKTPPPLLMKYVDELFRIAPQMPEEEDHDAAYVASGYKLKKESVREKFINEGVEYYNGLKDARGKTILSFDEYTQINKAVNQIKNGEFTAKYFKKPEEGIDIFYQFPIYWELKGQACKSLLDILVIDHKTKSIYPIDLKTTGKSVLNFRSAFMQYKYYLQASFYSGATNFWKANDTDLVDYNVKNFKFIVVETMGDNPPMIFQTTNNDLEVGEHGGTDKHGNEIKGYIELISDLNFHNSKNKWDFPKEAYDNNGVVMLNTMGS